MIFLRPLFLLALFIPFVFIWLNKRKEGKNPWIPYIDKELLKELSVHRRLTLKKLSFSKWVLLFWVLGVVALSGPAWHKVSVPAVQSQPNAVIVMDLGPALTASQIQQRQIKLYDILTLLKNYRVGLVLYGMHQGYVAMPLTPDVRLIENLIPSLTPDVLPDTAQSVEAGLKTAEKMLSQTGLGGSILFLSDQTGYDSVYPLMLVHPEKNSLQEVKSFLDKTKVLTTDMYSFGQADVWDDYGIWLALLCLIPACLFFRKNVLFLLLMLLSIEVQAAWFQREDQEQYALTQRGIQSYRQHDYNQAESFFQQSLDYYNLGNTLAFQGKIHEAIQSYQNALDINPEDSDAQFNKEYLEKQLSQQEQQGSDSQNQSGSGDDSQQDSKEGQQNSQGNNEVENEQSENQPTQDKTQTELEQALSEQPDEQTFNQEEQQILNRVQHDPARVLRYRLKLQYQKGNK